MVTESPNKASSVTRGVYFGIEGSKPINIGVVSADNKRTS